MSPRRKIGRFADAELIGRGGFGSVYRAEDVEHGRQVAVKVLQGTLGETERRRFDRERQTMGRLGSHPNIMPVHESGYTEEGEGYIVMELATGSLRDRLDAERQLSWQDAVPVAIAIAGAAQAAHDQGVLHRDIKPDNILIDTYGNPRLTDFGIASVASNQTATTSTSATLAHAAPELLEGRPSTEAVDVYAIGSTLYHLILGHPPFSRTDDSSVTALITRTLTEAPPDLAPYGVPAAIASVMARAVAKNPADRQASAAQVAAELSQALSQGAGASPTVAVPITPLGSETIVASSPMFPPTADPTAVANVQTPTGTNPVGARPQTQPLPSASPAGGSGGAGHGANPPITPFGAAAPSKPDKRRGGLLLVGLVIVAALIGAGVATTLAVSGNGSDTGSGTDIATATDDTTDSTVAEGDGDEEGEGANPDDGSTTTSPEDTTTTSTTTEDTTTTTEDTTTSSTTTTTTTTTTQPDSPCARVLVDTTTDRFNLRICSTNDGDLTYSGFDRPNDRGIDLNRTCFDGVNSFIARNNGFTYVIDLGLERLVVSDPDGVDIVNEPLRQPISTSPFEPAERC